MNLEAFKPRIANSLADVSALQWNGLLGEDSGPFLKYEFLQALESCGCVGEDTGWQVAHILIEDKQSRLIAAMPLYLKSHSYGEFVFDWAWAEAYAQHGLSYYPKALCAIPFTPVRGTRCLVGNESESGQLQQALLETLKTLVTQNQFSSAHILFPDPSELPKIQEQGFMLRDSVQFHWHNAQYKNFEEFLSHLTMKRRKNIRRERAQVGGMGIEYRHIPGVESTSHDWEFFYRCYENTYLEHRSKPYLNLAFFQALALSMPENLHLITAIRDGVPIAASLLIVDKGASKAYGRYWGALEHIPCLHFEVAYYQAIEFCIDQGIQTFEGGAQGEHKMARGFIPSTIQSAHWLADPQFSLAVQRFLEREQQGIAAYVNELEEHHPLKSTKVLL